MAALILPPNPNPDPIPSPNPNPTPSPNPNPIPNPEPNPNQVIRHEKYSRSADVYSFAMILFELLTHEVRGRVRVRVGVSLTEG